MVNQELKIEKSELPKILYHLVPKNLFIRFVDSVGSYDCRNKEEWGRNSPFIHTSPTKKQLKERVADMNWATYPAEEKFLLLEIDPQNIKAKFTYSITNGYTYHHIWGALPKNSFVAIEVERDKDGRFLI
jgi:uncharacterized protein (DUF952 family)